MRPIINLPPPIIEKVILEQPPEGLLDKDWFIALMGAVAGAILTTVPQVLGSWWRNRGRRIQLASGLIAEIIGNQRRNQRSLAAIREMRRVFSTMASSGTFTSHPSYLVTGLERIDSFFASHADDMKLLSSSLKMRIYLFYENGLAHVSAGAKVLQDRFEKYYANDPMVGAEDVIKALDDHIGNVEVLGSSGNALLAELLVIAGETSNITQGQEDVYFKNLKKVDAYLKEIQYGDKLNSSEVAQQLAVTEVTFIWRMNVHGHFLNPGKSGEYIKRKPPSFFTRLYRKARLYLT